MKKGIAVWMLLVLVLGLCACGGKQTGGSSGGKNAGTENAGYTDTVFVPVKLTITAADDEVIASTDIVYQEGWKEKDRFTATYNLLAMGKNGKCTITYHAGGDIMQYGPNMGIQKAERTLDEQGRVVRQVTYYQEGTLEKSEILTTYDAQGRTVKEVTNQYQAGQGTPIASVLTFTMAQTEEGSTGTCQQGAMKMVMTYDKENRLLRSVTTFDGREITRTEYTYDENGCQSQVCNYADSQLVTATKYQYKAEKVSPGTAQILTQFVRK